jgi:hypothetical protein
MIRDTLTLHGRFGIRMPQSELIVGTTEEHERIHGGIASLVPRRPYNADMNRKCSHSLACYR